MTSTSFFQSLLFPFIKASKTGATFNKVRNYGIAIFLLAVVLSLNLKAAFEYSQAVAAFFFFVFIWVDVQLVFANANKGEDTNKEGYRHYVYDSVKSLLLYAIFIFTIGLYNLNLVVGCSIPLVLYLASSYYKKFRLNSFAATRLIGGIDLSVVLLILLIVRIFFDKGHVLQSEFLLAAQYTLPIFSLICLLKIAFNLRPIKKVSYAFWMFALFLTATAYYSTYFEFNSSLTIVALYSAIYLVNLVRAVYADHLERSPGFFTPLILAGLQWIPLIQSIPYIRHIVIAYLCYNFIVSVYNGFKKSSSH